MINISQELANLIKQLSTNCNLIFHISHFMSIKKSGFVSEGRRNILLYICNCLFTMFLDMCNENANFSGHSYFSKCRGMTKICYVLWCRKKSSK